MSPRSTTFTDVFLPYSRSRRKALTPSVGLTIAIGGNSETLIGPSAAAAGSAARIVTTAANHTPIRLELMTPSTGVVDQGTVAAIPPEEACTLTRVTARFKIVAKPRDSSADYGQ